MSSRLLIIFLVGVVGAVLLHREQQRGAFAAVDNRHAAWLLENRQDKPPRLQPSVIMVRCDDADGQFESWPLSAGDWTAVLPELAGWNPKTISVLPPLAWGKEPDSLLQPSLAAIPSLLLATRAEGSGQGDGRTLPSAIKFVGSAAQLPQIRNFPDLIEQEKLGKLLPYQVDLTDEAEARLQVIGNQVLLPLLFAQGEKVYPSIILAAFLQHEGIADSAVEARLGEWIEITPKYRIPIDAKGRYAFHWHPLNRHDAPRINLDTFKLAQAQLDRFMPKSDPARQVLPLLKDSLCLIGNDDAASQRIQLPDGSRRSATEICAQLLAALQTGRNIAPMSEARQWGAWGIVLAFCLWLGTLRKPASWKMGILGLLVFATFSLLFYQTSAEWLPLTPGASLILGTILLCLILPRSPASPTPDAASKTVTTTVAALLLGIFLTQSAQAHHQPGVTIEMLNEQIAKTPEMPELYYQRGSEFLYLRKYDESLADFQKALSLRADYLPAKRLIAQITAEKGEIDKALQIIREGIATAPEDHAFLLPGCHSLEAALLLMKNDPAAALKSLDAALLNNRFPDLQIWRLRGEAFRLLGKNEERIKELKDGYERSKSVVIRNEWIEALIDSEKFDEVLPIVETELSSVRYRSSWLIRRGRIFLATKREAQAKIDLTEAIAELDTRISGELPPYLLVLDRGLAHALLGNLPEAREDLQRAKDYGAGPGEWRLLERTLKDAEKKAKP